MMTEAEKRRRRRTEEVQLLVFLVSIFSLWVGAESRCSRTCDAVASYYITANNNLTYITQLFSIPELSTVLRYNPQITNQYYIVAGARMNIPFSCNCLNDEISGHNFTYFTRSGDTYSNISVDIFKNLTTVDDLRKFNSYNVTGIPSNVLVSVPVNCSCGDESISEDYGFFLTYPLRPDENISDVITKLGAPSIELVQRYNQGKNLSSGQGLVFIPIKDPNNSTRPLKANLASTGISPGAITGISVAAVVTVLFLALCLYFGAYRKKKGKNTVALSSAFEDKPIQMGQRTVDGASPKITGITVKKSVEFSYEELAKATNDFSLANKIGEGGFGAVYYAEIRGEKVAIKKMDMQASREFLIELKVLTSVHHSNLVRLIGYCAKNSLFLVYEFIENGNLSQNLHGSGMEPLSWASRLQIALDAAVGIEYIHEHTIPAYIHRDIKSANILIDKNFHGKVADFGLTKLTEVGRTSLPIRLVGTFGYMPPEYAQNGGVSPKVDVYAFGVVLYELISAKEAVIRTGDSIGESRGLVALFEDAFNGPDPQQDLRKLVDPKLGDEYPIDSVHKMAQLAKACTQENPQLRPRMRAVVVALRTLSLSAEKWDVSSFYEKPSSDEFHAWGWE